MNFRWIVGAGLIVCVAWTVYSGLTKPNPQPEVVLTIDDLEIPMDLDPTPRPDSSAASANKGTFVTAEQSVELFAKMEVCVREKSSPVERRGKCLLNAMRLQEKFPALAPRFEQLRGDAGPDAVEFLKTGSALRR